MYMFWSGKKNTKAQKQYFTFHTYVWINILSQKYNFSSVAVEFFEAFFTPNFLME